MPFYNLRPRAGTASQWQQANTILREREIGFEYSDEGPGSGPVKMKMGDGTTPWNELPYATMPMNLTDGQGNAVYDLPITPQPNILDNADFKSGIINQRGFEDTTITGWSKKATVDRWIFSGSNNAIATINENSMSINGDSSLIQTLSNVLEAGEYTLAVNITSLSGTLSVSLVYTDDQTEDASITETGLFVHTFNPTKQVKAFTFRCNSGNSFTFNQAKIEHGSVYTGMPEYDYLREWNNCRRFYKSIKVVGISINGGTTETQYFNLPHFCDVPMAKRPTLENVNQTGFVYTWGNSPLSGTKISSISTFDDLTNMPLRADIDTAAKTTTLLFDLKLDAEAY